MRRLRRHPRARKTDYAYLSLASIPDLPVWVITAVINAGEYYTQHLHGGHVAGITGAYYSVRGKTSRRVQQGSRVAGT